MGSSSEDEAAEPVATQAPHKLKQLLTQTAAVPARRAGGKTWGAPADSEEEQDEVGARPESHQVQTRLHSNLHMMLPRMLHV